MKGEEKQAMKFPSGLRQVRDNADELAVLRFVDAFFKANYTNQRHKPRVAKALGRIVTNAQDLGLSVGIYMDMAKAAYDDLYGHTKKGSVIERLATLKVKKYVVTHFKGVWNYDLQAKTDSWFSSVQSLAWTLTYIGLTSQPLSTIKGVIYAPSTFIHITPIQNGNPVEMDPVDPLEVNGFTGGILAVLPYLDPCFIVGSPHLLTHMKAHDVPHEVPLLSMMDPRYTLSARLGSGCHVTNTIGDVLMRAGEVVGAGLDPEWEPDHGVRVGSTVDKGFGDIDLQTLATFTAEVGLPKEVFSGVLNSPATI